MKMICCKDLEQNKEMSEIHDKLLKFFDSIDLESKLTELCHILIEESEKDILIFELEQQILLNRINNTKEICNGNNNNNE